MRYLKPAAVLGATLALFWFFLRGVSWNQVGQVLGSLSLLHPVIFLLGILGQLWLRAIRWRGLIRPHLETPPPTAVVFNYIGIGFLLNMLPGKVGEAARGVLLAKRQQFNPSLGLATVAVERLLDTAVMLIMAAASLLLWASPPRIIVDNRHWILVLLVLSCLLLLGLGLLNLPSVRRFSRICLLLLCRLFPKAWRQRLLRTGIRFLDGLRLPANPRQALLILAQSLMVWLVLIPFYWWLLRAMGVSLSLGETVPYFCLILASAAIPTPGMAGSLDTVSKMALMELYQTPADLAVSITLVLHVLILLGLCLAGAWGMLREGLGRQSLLNWKEDSP